MKRMYFVLCCLCPLSVFADCVLEATTYTSCNAGYYLSSGSCVTCAKGYYKSSAGTATSCTRCPSSNGVYGTTAATGTTSVVSCYIPSGSTYTFSDSTGSGTATITSNCYYSN